WISRLRGANGSIRRRCAGISFRLRGGRSKSAASQCDPRFGWGKNRQRRIHRYGRIARSANDACGREETSVKGCAVNKEQAKIAARRQQKKPFCWQNRGNRTTIAVSKVHRDKLEA